MARKATKSDVAELRSVLQRLLAPDGWRLSDPSADSVCTAACADRRIHFYLARQGARLLQRALRRIHETDAGRFQEIGVLVAPTAGDLACLREDSQADKYPGAFFAAMDELRSLADGCWPMVSASPANVSSFPAQVVANRALGEESSPQYVLTFRADQIQEVWPSQFVMMDTTPGRPLLEKRAVRRGWWPRAADIDLGPQPVLKRPFGIQRAYHRHFDARYLQRLTLPPSLSPALHIVYPYQFDMLYKVLPDGLGTGLMRELKAGDTIHMLGPLGRPFDVRALRADGVQEVHVVGGGVGFAPLVFFVQALRYHGYRVKVFIGIAEINLLRYRGDVDAGFATQPADAYVYVDDLIETGVAPADIFLACDNASPQSLRGIPEKNLYHGLVPEQYRRYLAALGPEKVDKKIMTFTCGPDRMMQVMTDIASETGIGLKILMEKRMGCGYGVCLSCVCRVQTHAGEETYARVCTEGPVFDAGEILWNNNHWKPTSASSDCAPRC